MLFSLSLKIQYGLCGNHFEFWHSFVGTSPPEPKVRDMGFSLLALPTCQPQHIDQWLITPPPYAKIIWLVIMHNKCIDIVKLTRVLFLKDQFNLI